MLERLRASLPVLEKAAGRPSAPSGENAVWLVIAAVRDYALEHPGCVYTVSSRRVYSDGFRRFIVGLRATGQPGANLPLSELSEATTVPVGTLKEWIAMPFDGAIADEAAEAAETLLSELVIRSASLQLVVRLWHTWKGPLDAFCRMLQEEHRLAFKTSYVREFLKALGLLKCRRGRPVEAPWSPNTFRLFFPGAQWLGDGTEIGIVWNGQVFVFNLEAVLDAASNAMVGIAVSDAENEEAVKLAFMAAMETAGAAPVGMTLDNKACNHSPAVKESVYETIVLPSTLGRGQSKAPLEGAFGLFQQAMPPLEISGNTSREMAGNALRLIFTAWFRGRNGRPRKRFGGFSPAQTYEQARPTPDQFQRVIAYFQELERKQALMRATREARLDPVRMALLTEGLAELGLPDPERQLTLALAGYSREAILYGLSVFKGRQNRCTLPPGADGRYLGGIIRNHHEKLELMEFASDVLKRRIRLGDLSLQPLRQAESQIRRTTPGCDLTQAFVDRALHAAYTVDITFWTNTATAQLASAPTEQRASHYTALCQHIAAAFKTDRERRRDLINSLAKAVPP
jgi:transposase InsO family protein